MYIASLFFLEKCKIAFGIKPHLIYLIFIALFVSGTFIALDQIMRMYDEPIHSEIDVFNVVYQLRKERRYLVQTLSQYTYLYKCLYEHSQKNNSSWFSNVSKSQDRCILNILLSFSQSLRSAKTSHIQLCLVFLTADFWLRVRSYELVFEHQLLNL